MKKIIVIALGLIAAWGLLTAPAQAQVRLQIGFLIDGSGSIQSSDFQLIVDSLSDALGDPTLIPHDGTIEITVVQFGNNTARMELSPTVLTANSAGGIQQAIRSISQLGGNTPLPDGVDLLTQLMTSSGSFATAPRQVINVATDGQPNLNNDGITTQDEKDASFAARDRAVAAGIDEIDAEGLGVATTDDEFRNFLRDFVWPQPGEIVDDGGTFAPGFVRMVLDIQDFRQAVREKIQAILDNADLGEGTIGVAKQVERIDALGNGEFEVRFLVTVENLGTVDLGDVQVTDDLSAAFPTPAGFRLTAPPTATGTLSPNGGFTGTTDTRLLAAGSTLPAGAVETIRFSVRVDPAGLTSGFCNAAVATGTFNGVQTSDTSDDGTDPDPNGNGDPTEAGENDCTPIQVSGPGPAPAAVPFDSPWTLTLLSLVLVLWGWRRLRRQEA